MCTLVNVSNFGKFSEFWAYTWLTCITIVVGHNMDVPGCIAITEPMTIGLETAMFLHWSGSKSAHFEKMFTPHNLGKFSELLVIWVSSQKMSMLVIWVSSQNCGHMTATAHRSILHAS